MGLKCFLLRYLFAEIYEFLLWLELLTYLVSSLQQEIELHLLCCRLYHLYCFNNLHYFKELALKLNYSEEIKLSLLFLKNPSLFQIHPVSILVAFTLSAALAYSH